MAPPTWACWAGSCASRTRRRPLLDGDGPLHALLAVVSDRAVHRVVAGLEVDRQRTRVAGRQVLWKLLLDPVALDLEVVGRVAVVGHLEDHRPGLGRDLVRIEREVGLADVDRLATAGRARGARSARGAGGRRRSRRCDGRLLVVIAAAAGDERESGHAGDGQDREAGAAAGRWDTQLLLLARSVRPSRTLLNAR